MNILILNWRDPKNSFAGGAEKVTFKYAQYWKNQGHNVYWISNIFPNAIKRENIDGVEIIRTGPFFIGNILQLCFKYPVYLLNSIWMALKVINDANIDLVVDEIHGLPFFSPLFFRGRKILLVCEVADEIWSKMFPFPINKIGILIEKFVYALYRNTQVWAISESTKKDILRIDKNLNCIVLPLGIDGLPKGLKMKKNSFPTAVFLARMVKMKGAESALIACSEITKDLPNFKLHMIGGGSLQYMNYLSAFAQKLGISKNVIFEGKVSEQKKYALLLSAHFLIHPSFKEGFGLTILEAGLCGTPCIARKGSSLEELIEDGKDGVLFDLDLQISSAFIKHYNTVIFEKMSQAISHKAKKYLWPSILKQSESITKIYG